MAPLQDKVVDDLKSLVNKLESRVAELEQKLAGRDASSTSGVRMILMGPPGAGMWIHVLSAFCRSLRRRYNADESL
jgi:hypothetical protein